jgi:hypothetical protein
MTEKTPKERVEDYREKNLAVSAGMSEAPGIAFCTLYMDGLPVNLTARAMTPYDALASLKISINLAEEFLGVARQKDIPQAPPPAKHPVDKDFPPTDPNEPVYETLDNFEGLESSEVTSINILPQPDDKVSLEFIKEGMKWPVCKVNKWKVENAVNLLESVTSQDLTKPAEVKVTCKVYWAQGNETAPGSGKYYKNVKFVR